MKCLTIKQPWAWLIVRPDLSHPVERAKALAAGEIKDVENRTWATKYRGVFLVHAGQSFDMDGYHWVKCHFPGIPLPTPERFERGGIIGQVELTDSVPPEKALHGQVKSRWYMGEHAFILSQSLPLPFRAMKGRLGFYEVPQPGVRVE